MCVEKMIYLIRILDLLIVFVKLENIDELWLSRWKYIKENLWISWKDGG